MKPKRKIFFTMLGASLAFAGCLTAYGVSMNINTPDKNALSDEQENIPALEYVDSGGYCCTDNGYNDNAVSNNVDRNISTFGQNIISKFFKSNSKTELANNINENTNNNIDSTNDSIVNAKENSQESTNENSQESTNENPQSQADSDSFRDLGTQYIESITYIDADGNQQVCPCARVITKDDNVLYGNDPKCKGWYVVNQNTERSGDNISGVKCEGDVKLIIEKCCTYKVVADCGDAAAINVTGNNRFSLYSQVREAADSSENGKLYVQGDDGAGIGGNPGEDGCNINIYGCVVEYFREEAVDSAGIGGGDGKSGHDITIKRAVIKSERYQYFDVDGAGIGGGDDGEGKNINITDSIFTDKSFSSYGALIGGGHQGSGHDITLTNVKIGGSKFSERFSSDGLGAVIGGGEDGAGYDIELIDCSMYIYKDGDLDGTGAIIGGGDEAEGYNITIERGSYYLFQEYDDDRTTFMDTAAAAAIGGGENSKGHDITIKGSTIDATGGNDSAAIGGGQGCKGYNITIENSNVTAKGGEDGAGIGGGDNSMGYGIKIKGGTVTAKGGENGAGIGCGDDADYDCSQDELNNAIIIEGNGTVNAYGGDDAAGIGGGSNPDDDCVLGIHIKGGTVNAYGGSGSYGGGAGIGGGNDNHGKVTITGGTVNAHGGSGNNGGGAGIGGGDEGYGTVDIYDGVINAYGGGCASGIGGGDDDDDDDDKRSGVSLHAPAQVYAEKGPDGDEAMAIGCGDGGNAPAVWAFPELVISKCVGSNWSEVDYTAKHNPDYGVADNIVNQIYNTEKIKITNVKAVTPDMIQPISDQTVKSEPLMPYPIVKDGSSTLEYGRDYNLHWGHNQSIGIGKVYVDGINNYKGTTEAEFKIVPTTQDRTHISYMENGQEKFVDALPYDAKYDSLSDGWYYVYGDVTVNHSITVNGDIHILLVDGANLNFNCGSSYPFIYGDSSSKITLNYQYLHSGMINTQRGRTQLNEVSFDSVHNVAHCNVHIGGNIDVSKISGITFNSDKGIFTVNDLHISSNHLNYSIDIDKYKSVFRTGKNIYKITIGYDGRSLPIVNFLYISEPNTLNDQVSPENNESNIDSSAGSGFVKSLNDYAIKKDEE